HIPSDSTLVGDGNDSPPNEKRDNDLATKENEHLKEQNQLLEKKFACLVKLLVGKNNVIQQKDNVIQQQNSVIQQQKEDLGDALEQVVLAVETIETLRERNSFLEDFAVRRVVEGLARIVFSGGKEAINIGGNGKGVADSNDLLRDALDFEESVDQGVSQNAERDITTQLIIDEHLSSPSSVTQQDQSEASPVAESSNISKQGSSINLGSGLNCDLVDSVRVVNGVDDKAVEQSGEPSVGEVGKKKRKKKKNKRKKKKEKGGIIGDVVTTSDAVDNVESCSQTTVGEQPSTPTDSAITTPGPTTPLPPPEQSSQSVNPINLESVPSKVPLVIKESLPPLPPKEPTTDILTESEKNKVTKQLKRRLKLVMGMGISAVDFQKLLTLRPLRLRGLKNMTNTCYLNTVLQCIHAIPPLRDVLLGRGPYLQGYLKEDLPDLNGSPLCLTNELRHVFSSMEASSEKESSWNAFAPRQFKKLLGRLNGKFNSFQQEDAFECLELILNRVHDELNTGMNNPFWETEAPEGCTMETTKTGRYKISKGREQGWLLNNDLSYNPQWSIITDLFSGELQHDRTCMSCSRISSTVDLFYQYVVPLDVSEPCSDLVSYLDYHTFPGMIEEYTCRDKLHGCKKKGESLQTASFSRLPPFLTIVLGRFNTFKEKCHLHVDFPISGLNMSKYVSTDARAGPMDSYVYDLFAVTYHRGETLKSGHYTANVLDQTTGKWYYCDDGDVFECDPEFVKSEEAYILFY
ncbi:Ubiquitin carboxyl-terminal hydrolase 8, partial [Blyttiomyces sp. JEL0837]